MPLIQRYEQTLILLLSCLSVGCFVLFCQILLFPNALVGVFFFLSMLVVSLILVSKSFLSEKKHEAFDLTSPTIFETGLLAFQSLSNHCAVFFSFHLASCKFEKALAQRTLTILLKVLPNSSVLALEWTNQKECFINFYIKLEKTSFLTRSKELMQNITSNLKKVLGANNVHVLTGEEVMKHLLMGAPGRIQKLTVNNRLSISLKTNLTSIHKYLKLVKPLDNSTLNHILKSHNTSCQVRIILPMRKTEKGFQISDSLLVVSEEQKHSLESQLEPGLTTIVDVPASNSIRIFGDILSRNLVQEHYTMAHHSHAVNLILSLVSPTPPDQVNRESPFLTSDGTLSQSLNPLNWRELLNDLASKLEISQKKDAIIFVDNIPMRFDVQIGSLLFFIFSQDNEQQLKWLINKLNRLLNIETGHEIALLLVDSKRNGIIHKIMSTKPMNNRIHVISSQQELASLLKDYKIRVLNGKKLVTQVV